MNLTLDCSDTQVAQELGDNLTEQDVSKEHPQPEVSSKRVGEVMQTVVNSIEAKASVMAAINRMCLSGADCLMVMEEDRCVGLLTDRDLIVGCVCRHRRPTRTYVRDIMSAVSAYCLTSHTIADVLVMMTRLGASWLPVNDENGNAIGLVGRKYLHSRTAPAH